MYVHLVRIQSRTNSKKSIARNHCARSFLSNSTLAFICTWYRKLVQKKEGKVDNDVCTFLAQSPINVRSFPATRAK
jgi:hypothetical protein